MRKVLNNKVLLLVVAILLVANITMLFFFVWAKPPKRNFHGERQRSPVTVFLEQQLGFDKQQMATYEKIRQQHRQKMRPLFEEIRLAKVNFYGLLNNPAINDSEVNRAASSIGERQKAVDLQAFQNFKEIRTLCTASQLPRYDSLVPGIIANMWFPPRKSNIHQDADSLIRKNK